MLKKEYLKIVWETGKIKKVINKEQSEHGIMCLIMDEIRSTKFQTEVRESLINEIVKILKIKKTL